MYQILCIECIESYQRTPLRTDSMMNFRVLLNVICNFDLDLQATITADSFLVELFLENINNFKSKRK